MVIHTQSVISKITSSPSSTSPWKRHYNFYNKYFFLFLQFLINCYLFCVCVWLFFLFYRRSFDLTLLHDVVWIKYVNERKKKTTENGIVNCKGKIIALFIRLRIRRTKKDEWINSSRFFFVISFIFIKSLILLFRLSWTHTIFFFFASLFVLFLTYPHYEQKHWWEYIKNEQSDDFINLIWRWL